MKAGLVSLFVLCACGRPVADTASSPSARASAVEPAPAYHAYPEIPPDEVEVAAPLPAIESCQALPSTPPAPAPAPRRRIASGPPFTNHIPPEVVQRPMRVRAACWRQCFAHLDATTQRGRIVVRFVIDTDGFVRRSRLLKTELSDRSVGECVARQILGMEFAKPEGAAVTVEYPFVYEPGE